MESIFNKIDKILGEFVKEVNGRLTKDRDGSTLDLWDFEERRIDWIKNDIKLAIIIQPDIFGNRKNLDRWNVSIVAWKHAWPKRHSYVKQIRESALFSDIENEIRFLLKDGFNYLDRLEFKDLIPSKY